MHGEDKKTASMLEKEQLFELDVSEARDWSYAMSNLIEAEVHLHKTYVETKNDVYLELIEALRQLRKDVFEDFMHNKAPGLWCWSKHMLSLMMQLSEVASKELDEGRTENAKKYFTLSQRVLELFVATIVKPKPELLNTQKEKK